MTSLQKESIARWLGQQRQVVSASHGMCEGADEDFHIILRNVLGHDVFIAGFPSTATSRSRMVLDCDYVAPAKRPLERNPDIVNAGKDVLLAAPCAMHELQRSGTWNAIRYATRKKIRVEIFWPMEKERKCPPSPGLPLQR